MFSRYCQTAPTEGWYTPPNFDHLGHVLPRKCRAPEASPNPGDLPESPRSWRHLDAQSFTIRRPLALSERAVSPNEYSTAKGGATCESGPRGVVIRFVPTWVLPKFVSFGNQFPDPCLNKLKERRIGSAPFVRAREGSLATRKRRPNKVNKTHESWSRAPPSSPRRGLCRSFFFGRGGGGGPKMKISAQTLVRSKLISWGSSLSLSAQK